MTTPENLSAGQSVTRAVSSSGSGLEDLLEELIGDLDDETNA
ncbi:hypothetical protein [Amycolatopsis sp. NBRC 101858]|nr:hypothetical protein [Amycolatopsis sp. NBRC 101858]